MKKIPIKSCIECPYKDHKGAFAAVSYVPCCSAADGRKLPHTVSGGERGGLYASPTGIIPEWCPLPDDK